VYEWSLIPGGDLGDRSWEVALHQVSGKPAEPRPQKHSSRSDLRTSTTARSGPARIHPTLLCRWCLQVQHGGARGAFRGWEDAVAVPKDRRAPGPWLLLSGRGGAGNILTMAATVVAGILAFRLAATSRMASSRDWSSQFRGGTRESFVSWRSNGHDDYEDMDHLVCGTAGAKYTITNVVHLESGMVESRSFQRVIQFPINTKGR
jgi:hypothetical protein